MEKIIKENEKVVFVSDMDVSLANAIRRSVNEIPILAFEEVDIYKNDSALYDEMIAHRIGLIPLQNQKVKEGDVLEFKLKTKANGESKYVLSGDFGKDVVYSEIPITFIEGKQEVEIVGKAVQGKGVEHSKFSPGIIYYYYLNDIKTSKPTEKAKKLVESYPNVFSLENDKLTVKNSWALQADPEDLEEYKEVEIKPTQKLVFNIESWGQIKASEIFVESIKALSKNLSELSKALK